MRRIRVLVVDDSSVMRRMLSDALGGDPALEVVGTAENGRVALARIAELRPDIVTLDLEMPEMGGLEMLVELRRRDARLPVLVFSTLSARGATETLEALALGASDYVTKPAQSSGLQESIARIRSELGTKIKLHAGAVLLEAGAPPAAVTIPAATAATPSARMIKPEIVAIGVSTGGPNALATVIPALPRDFPLPIVIVQHMPPTFTRLLAERLAAKSAIRVREAVAGDRLEPGRALIAPGDWHMVVERGAAGVAVGLHQGEPENSCRPAVDPLFRSVASVFGARTLAVVLTGMGSDGVKGGEVIKAAGGAVLAQDQATSVVWGMPGLVARSGLADLVLPLEAIGPELARRSGRVPATVPAGGERS